MSNEKFFCDSCETPKEKTNQNYKIKYEKSLKENKMLRKEITKIKRTFKKIHELSSR